MKSIIYKTGILLVSLVTFLSCDMDRYPLTAFGEGDFFTSEENAKLAIIGLYRGNILINGPEYSPSDWWGYGANILLDGVSDIGYDRRGFNNAIGQLTSGNLLANNGYITPLYQQPFRRISVCTRFIANVDNIGTSAEVTRLKAEARFIRACSYFYLASYYHDVPLVTSVLSLEEANNVTKSSRAEVLNYVAKELEEIADQLPRQKDLPGSELGRATAQAALIFLARTHLLAKNYSAAAAACKKIIDWGDNSLHNNYQTLFYPSGKSSAEHIFAVFHLDNDFGYGLPQHAFPIKDGGWCLVNGTSILFEAYDFLDGTPFSYDDPRFNPDNFGEGRDPRLDYTLIYEGSMFRGSQFICNPETNSADKFGPGQVTQTGYLLRKYFDEGWTGDLNKYGGIVPIARYAEVLLMYLEAELEGGNAITQSLLDQTINKVRARVGMAPVTDTNPATLREKIRKERMVEFAFEGHRLWDLFRWGNAVEQLNLDLYGAPVYVNDPSKIKMKGGKPDPYNRWYANTRAFKAGQEKWPIPQAEQNINPNLR
ncbi:RagB/SusD family nutrient uptake outer membrane protein [Parabacteroides sp. OttesenSCG-928-K15]|nr:RagB/SusD family nutrient uptake outer membrane protein [Parabacteroides sp. OttesenSCG-928-K15]